MATIAEALALALEHHQAGNLPEAEGIYGQILQMDPVNADALHLMGVLAHQRGQQQLALAYLRQALELRPLDAGSHHYLGLVYQALGQRNEAGACYQQALRLQPDFPEALNNWGNTLKEQGQLHEAGRCYREAVRLKADYPEAHNNLGILLRQQGLLNEAIICYRQALALQSDYAAAHNNLGNALREQGRREEAIACYRQALHSWPDFPQAHHNLGSTLRDQGRLEEAVACYRQALALRPDFPEAHYHLGNALQDQGERDQAMRCYQEALHLRPGYAEAHLNLGNAMESQGRLEEAEDHLREACRLQPGDPRLHGSLLMCLNYAPHSTPATLLAEHRCWADRHGNAATPVHANRPDPGRRLRVGYVSPDLRQHPVAAFLEPILAHHDRAQVEAFCYAEVPVPDASSARLRALVPGWRFTSGLSDTEVAAQIRADGIDLLVDLAGHTAHNRLLVFALKPAPVQLTYLGYPTTTGLAAIDYRLTDAVADPPGELAYHTEELWRLPGCFCCYTPPPGAPAVASSPVLGSGHLTFGSFHKLAKLNGQVLDLWCRLLHALPTALLLVCYHSLMGEARARLHQELERRGIGSGRFELRQGVPGSSGAHLALYAEVDVLLDTFPWGGHTTASEALWMGVPVLTLAGDRHAGRMVNSVLHNLDLAEWVARTPDEYIERGVRLTTDSVGLAELRGALRGRMRASPLCDGPAFTRRLEEAYRTMWQRWCAGNANN